MTQYLLSVYVNDDEMASVSEADTQAVYAAVDAFNEQVRASGAWVFAGGLHPVSTATTVTPKAGDAVVTDGPYAETKEYLGGFWVIEAEDLDAALAWAKQAAVACGGPVEVRPFEADAG